MRIKQIVYDREHEANEKEEPARSGRPWLGEEVQSLKSAVEKGESLVAWARSNGRRFYAVLCRLKALGLMSSEAPYYEKAFTDKAKTLSMDWLPEAPLRKEVVGALGYRGSLVSLQGVEGNTSVSALAVTGLDLKQEKLKEENMKSITIEKVTRINGKDSDQYSDRELLQLLADLNKQKSDMEDFPKENDLARVHLVRTKKMMADLTQVMNERARALPEWNPSQPERLPDTE